MLQKTTVQERLDALSDGFMKPEISYESVVVYEAAEGGTTLVPEYACLLTDLTPDELKTAEHQTGWIGRLSAPGYLDATEFVGPFSSPEEVIDVLETMYGKDAG